MIMAHTLIPLASRSFFFSFSFSSFFSCKAKREANDESLARKRR